MSSYHSIKLRVISTLLALVFGLTEATYAAPVSVATPAVINRIAIANFVDSPSRLDIPLENVMLKEVHTGTSGKLIIHIQDAHANLSGQQNLAKALDHFMTRYDLDLVLVEGSSRDASLHEVRKTGPLDEWKIIARRFLYDGIISGEEYLNLTSEHPMKIMGVEYEGLYDDSIKAYAALVDKRTDILHYLYRAKVAVGRLKQRLYPETLLKYEASRNKDDSIGYHLGPNFAQLLELAETSDTSVQGFSEVKKLDVLRKSEKTIDFSKANDQQQKLLKELSKRGEDSTVRRFLEDSKRFSNVQISQYLLMRQMLNLARDKNITLQTFPELLVYERYLREFADLELHTLLNELELLEDIVFERMLKTADAKKTRAIDRFLTLLGNAYKLQMSSKDYKLYEFNEEDFPTESWLAFMNQKLAQLGFFESMMPYKPYLENARNNLDKFYTLVGKRDEAFVENAKRIMSAQKVKAAVLIAGGYHTDNLTELLKKEDASYVVLTPVVTEKTDHGKYEDLLLAALREQEGRLLKGAEKEDAFEAKKIMTRKMPRGLRKEGAAEYIAASRAAEESVRNIVGSRLGKRAADEVVRRFTGVAQKSANDPDAPIPIEGPAAVEEPKVEVVIDTEAQAPPAIPAADEILTLEDVTAEADAAPSLARRLAEGVRSVVTNGRIKQYRKFMAGYLLAPTAASRLAYFNPPGELFDYLDLLKGMDVISKISEEEDDDFAQRSAEVHFFSLLLGYSLASSQDIDDYRTILMRLMADSSHYDSSASPFNRDGEFLSRTMLEFLFEQRENQNLWSFLVERRFRFSITHTYLRRLHQHSLTEVEEAASDRKDLAFREWVEGRINPAMVEYSDAIHALKQAEAAAKEAVVVDKSGEMRAQLPTLRRNITAYFTIAIERGRSDPDIHIDEMTDFLGLTYADSLRITGDEEALAGEIMDLIRNHLKTSQALKGRPAEDETNERLDAEIAAFATLIRDLQNGGSEPSADKGQQDEEAARLAGEEGAQSFIYPLLRGGLELPTRTVGISDLSLVQREGARLALSGAASRVDADLFIDPIPLAVADRKFIEFRMNKMLRLAWDPAGDRLELLTDQKLAREIAGDEIVTASGKTRKIGPEFHAAMGDLLARLREAKIKVQFNMSETIFGGVRALKEVSTSFDRRITRRGIATLSTQTYDPAVGPTASRLPDVTPVNVYATSDPRDKVRENEVTLVVKTAPGTHENPLAAKVIGLAFALFRATWGEEEIDQGAIEKFLVEYQPLFSSIGIKIDAKTAEYMTKLPNTGQAFTVVYNNAIDLNYESLAEALAGARLVQQTADIAA